MSTSEQIYDAEIAPELMKLAARCKELGFAMVASVEWEAGETGRTEAHGPWGENGIPSAKQKLVHWAARCNGNIDTFLMAVMRDAEKHGHSSIYLRMLGCKNEVPGDGVAAFMVTTPK